MVTQRKHQERAKYYPPASGRFYFIHGKFETLMDDPLCTTILLPCFKVISVHNNVSALSLFHTYKVRRHILLHSEKRVWSPKVEQKRSGGAYDRVTMLQISLKIICNPFVHLMVK